MKTLVRLLLVTLSLLVATICTQEHDQSHENLQKMKRAAMRRNSGGKPQKVPKFGWGKRRADFPDLSSLGASSLSTKHDLLDNSISQNQPWGSPAKRENRNKCDWYGCRVERSGWDSQYGKRNIHLGSFSRDRKTDEYDFGAEEKRQVNRNGWNSAYGRRRREAFIEDLDDEE